MFDEGLVCPGIRLAETALVEGHVFLYKVELTEEIGNKDLRENGDPREPTDT